MDNEWANRNEVMRVDPPGAVTASAQSEYTIKVMWVWGASPKHAVRLICKSDGQSIGEYDAPVTAVSFVIPDLNPNTQYQIQVFGLDGEELSPYSRDAQATTKPATSLPASPTDLTATPTKDAMYLRWSGPANATSYKVSYGVASGSEIKTETSSQPEYYVTGLTTNTNYYFDVRSSNNFGDSEPTRVIKQTLKPPATPANLRATATTTSMDLEWSAAAEAKQYVIRYGVEPGGSPETATTSLLKETLKNLTKNTLYYIELSAANDNGESPPARITSRTQDGPKLSPPDNVVASPKTESSILVQWMWGPSGQFATRLIWMSGGQPVGEHNVELPLLKYEITGLNPNTQYLIRVFGRNGEELSSLSKDVEATTPPPAVSLPQKPSALEARPSLSSMSLTWASAPGATGYKVSYGLASDGPVIKTETTSQRAHVLTGLLFITQYYFEVRASNSAGDSEPVRVVKQTLFPPVTDDPICSPGHLRGMRNSATSALLSWDEPYATCTLCPDAENYFITGEGITTMSVAHSPCEVKGLAPDREYRLSVWTKASETNISVPSEVLIGRQPGVPRSLQITEVSHTSATLSWLAPINLIALFDYVIYCNGVFVGAARGLTYLLTHLEPSVSYAIEIRARSVASSLSEPVQGQFTTGEPSAPGAPSNFRYKNAGPLFTLEWDVPVEGGLVDGYRVVLTDPLGIKASYNPAHPTVSALLLAARYQVVITARNSAGDSLPLFSELIVR